MAWSDPDEEDMDASEILRLILAEMREISDKLSDIRSDLSEISSNLSDLSDVPSATEGSGAEIAAAIKSTGAFTLILLGFILWRVW